MQSSFPAVLGQFATGPSNGVTSFTIDSASKLVALGFIVDVARTLNTVRLCATVTGSLGSGDVSCAIYSDNAGTPGTSLASTSTTSGGTWATGWVTFTGLSLALTPGVQYWAVISNTNSAPASNRLAVSYLGSSAGSTIVSGSQQTYGWVVKTYNGTSWSSAAASSGGYRLGYADGGYHGVPVSAIVITNSVYGTTEWGVRFTVPPSGSLAVAGASMFLNCTGTPTTPGYVYKLYTGTTSPVLVATSGMIPTASIKAGIGWFSAYFPASITLAAGTVVTLTLAASAAGDTSSNRALIYEYDWDGDINSVPLQPLGGTSKAGYNGTAWTVMANASFPFLMLLDTASPTVKVTGTYTAPGNVRSGVDRGDGTTGTLVVPAAGSVLAGTTFDNGTAGTVTVPAASQVLSGVDFGAGGKALTGTVTLPAVGYVQTGIAYGADGTQFTGMLSTTGITLGDLQTELTARGLTTALSGTITANLDTPVSSIKAVTDRINTALQPNGSGGYQYTALALANATTGSAVADWSTAERNQIRYRLGIDGTSAAPAATPALTVTVTGKPAVTLAASDLSGAVSANVTQWGGTGITTPNVSGVPMIDLAYVNGQATSMNSAPISANVTQWSGTSVAAPDAAGFPRVTIKAGTGAGELNLAGGNLAGPVPGVTAPVNIADKTGFSLATTGLDAIPVTDPGAPANQTTLSRMIVALWRRSYKKTALNSTQFLTYADDGVTPNSTQTVSDDGTVQTLGPAT